MINTFERDGIRFQHPANWTLEQEADADGGWSVTLLSPETAFLLMTLRPDADNAAQLADQTLDADNAIGTFAGQLAIGHEIDFLTLDVAVTCWTRCVQTLAGPLLVMCQVSEFEHEQHEPVLRAICASMTIEEE